MFHHLNIILFIVFPAASLSSDDVEFEVAPDRRTGKPIAVKLLKIKPEVLTEERISGQVGPVLHAYPFSGLHGYIHPVKEYHFIFGSVLLCHLYIYWNRFGQRIFIVYVCKIEHGLCEIEESFP